MDYGIGIPSYIEAWREVRAAEEAGFTHAWFYDSQLIYSDVWSTMALAAQNTKTIKLGTLVAIPSNRLAAVTAAAAAFRNAVGVGTAVDALVAYAAHARGIGQQAGVERAVAREEPALEFEGHHSYVQVCERPDEEARRLPEVPGAEADPEALHPSSSWRRRRSSRPAVP